MATREQRRRINALVVGFCLVFGGMMVYSMIHIALSEGMLVPKSKLYADFRDAGSVGQGTLVQLAGKEIGKVVSIAFITQRYPCNPQTEDYGHPSQGRTNDCEPWMFCAAVDPDTPEDGLCAVLEEFSGHSSDYTGCQGPGTCGPGQVCVTRAFRMRYRGVRWWGQAGWCVAYDTNAQRIRVTMEVEKEALQFIREDSQASIVLNGVLADPRVNIGVGAKGRQLEDGDRLQTKPSLIEEALGLKDQIDKLAADIDRGLIGLQALTDVLTDDKAKADIESIRKHVGKIKRQMASAEGLVGAVLNDPGTRSEMSKTLREVRDAAVDAQDEYDRLERSVKRTVRDVEGAAEGVERIVEGLDNPDNTSLVAVLVNEDHGVQDAGARLADNTEEAIGAGREAIADIDAALDEIGKALSKREGSLGRIIKDPKPLYHIKDPATLRRVNVVKRLVRWVVAEDEAEGETIMEGEEPGPDPGTSPSDQTLDLEPEPPEPVDDRDPPPPPPPPELEPE